MKKILFVILYCLCLCGCEKKEVITICNYHGSDFPNEKHIITIKHVDDKITYYKNEYETIYDTITEAQEEIDNYTKDLTCSNDVCYSSLEGDNGWKYKITRDNKTVFLTQEINNYEKSYNEVIKYLESLNSYECNEK